VRLLKDRNFNIAIVLSATWHLVFMFSISPVLIPVDIKQNSTKISFLGSILKKVAITTERSVSLDKASLIERIERARDIDSRDLVLRPPEHVSKGVDIESDKERFIFFSDKDEAVVFKRRYKKQEPSEIRFGKISISGEARNREMLYSPDLSRVATLSPYFGSDYTVTIKFKISRDGFVENPECIFSSGSPDIDQMAIRYVREWQFVPHEGPELIQEGIVRVNF